MPGTGEYKGKIGLHELPKGLEKKIFKIKCSVPFTFHACGEERPRGCLAGKGILD